MLLRAFLSAFTAADNVLLLLHTKPFHSEPDFPQQMQVGWDARSPGLQVCLLCWGWQPPAGMHECFPCASQR